MSDTLCWQMPCMLCLLTLGSWPATHVFLAPTNGFGVLPGPVGLLACLLVCQPVLALCRKQGEADEHTHDNTPQHDGCHARQPGCGIVQLDRLPEWVGCGSPADSQTDGVPAAATGARHSSTTSQDTLQDSQATGTARTGVLGPSAEMKVRPSGHCSASWVTSRCRPLGRLCTAPAAAAC